MERIVLKNLIVIAQKQYKYSFNIIKESYTYNANYIILNKSVIKLNSNINSMRTNKYVLLIIIFCEAVKHSLFPAQCNNVGINESIKDVFIL